MPPPLSFSMRLCKARICCVRAVFTSTVPLRVGAGCSAGAGAGAGRCHRLGRCSAVEGCVSRLCILSSVARSGKGGPRSRRSMSRTRDASSCGGAADIGVLASPAGGCASRAAAIPTSTPEWAPSQRSAPDGQAWVGWVAAIAAMDTSLAAAVLVMAVAAVALFPLARSVLSRGGKAVDAPDAPEPRTAPESPAATKSKKPRKRATKSSGPAPDPDEDARSVALPPLAEGVKCWHRQEKVEVTVVKVYFDDPPPYYTIRMPDGTERATVRARLESKEERREAEEAAQREYEEAEKAKAEVRVVHSSWCLYSGPPPPRDVVAVRTVTLTGCLVPGVLLCDRWPPSPQMHAQAMADALIAEEEKRPNRKGGSDREKKGGKEKKR